MVSTPYVCNFFWTKTYYIYYVTQKSYYKQCAYAAAWIGEHDPSNRVSYFVHGIVLYCEKEGENPCKLLVGRQ